jgi:hypothetical protein
MASESFLMRKLLWDELKLRVQPSEEEELRVTIGNYLIADNEVQDGAGSVGGLPKGLTILVLGRS